MAEATPRRLPLAGVRALEIGEIWAGPFCGTMLADLGAEVIKVESLQRMGRGALNPSPGSPDYPDRDPGERPWDRAANFNSLNRSKKAITLDLASSRGVDGFKDLVNVSDVVFSNYAYGVMDRFGLGYDDLKQVRPDIVVLLMPGYGDSGPYKRYRSMGMTIDAITGHTSLRGYPDLGLDHNALVHHPDAVGAATAAFAVCAALHHRARFGQGQFIDLSQGESFTPHMGEIFLEGQMAGGPRERRGNRDPGMAPHGCYPCEGEDRWVAIAVRDDAEWRAFRNVVGATRLNDARFDSLADRLANQDELDAIVTDWTSTRDRYDVTERLQAAGVPAGPVLDSGPDIYDDPHLQARDYFAPVDHPEAGTHVLSGKMWRLASNPDRGQTPAPCLGEHNGDVLAGVLGYPETRMAELEREHVIGTVPLQGSDMGGVRRAAQS